jgi:hypothetical protein
MSSTAEKFLEIENISLRTGHIQFLRVDEFFHGKGINAKVKIENNS